MRGITRFFVHYVSVETYQGTGAVGDVYASPVTVTGFLDGKTQLVRDATGQQVVSASSLYCSVADGARFTPDSRVTVAGPGALAPGQLTPGPTPPSSIVGRVSYAISQNVNDAPGLGLPEHAQINLK